MMYLIVYEDADGCIQVSVAATKERAYELFESVAGKIIDDYKLRQLDNDMVNDCLAKGYICVSAHFGGLDTTNAYIEEFNDGDWHSV